MRYEPTWESVRSHQVPDWYHDAKLGIFVHWGLYSVPGWAPTTGDLDQVIAKEGWGAWFRKNPDAEWYLHSLRIEGSPTHQYHLHTYGPDFAYDDFVPMFNQAIQAWDPQAWATLFREIGARYVVLTTRHCESFALWPTEHPCPLKADYRANRDIVGDLTCAVRDRGMRMGLYYCSGMDWVFNQEVIKDFPDVLLTIPQSPEYVAYVNTHWHELIDRYRPSIMWGDIGYPAATHLPELFAYYYNQVPEGVINDRFTQYRVPSSRLARAALRLGIRLLAPILVRRNQGSPPGGAHYDFRTPEYTSYDRIVETKWESTRGIGHSFGYNRNEGPEDYLSVEKLVHMFVDIVSKNGNLLLNVGPMADGTIPELQRQRLEGLGAWLAVHGEAIYGTRPWVQAEGQASEGLPVRFTKKGQVLYATLLGTPKGEQVTMQSLRADDRTTVHLLGRPEPLPWRQGGGSLTITLPRGMIEAPAHALRIEPLPALVS